MWLDSSRGGFGGGISPSEIESLIRLQPQVLNGFDRDEFIELIRELDQDHAELREKEKKTKTSAA